MSVATVIVGTGYLGRRFKSLFQGQVIGLNRPTFDLDAGISTPELPRPFNLLYTVPPSRESLEDVRLARLLDVLDPAPRRFIYISTTGVYGNHDGADVDEETPPNPETDRARRRVSAEHQVLDFADRCGSTAVILRVPGIYGPGRLGIERIRDGMPVIREQDTGPGNRIHVDDLAACCEAALSDDVPGGIYNVGDGDSRTSTWFSNEVARQCGLELPPSIPMSEAEQQFSSMRLSFLRESRRVRVDKMRTVLGVTPIYSNAEDGIAASLD